MKKSILILLTIVSCFFVSSLEVRAEEKLICNYKIGVDNFYSAEISISYPDKNGQVKVEKNLNNIKNISKIELLFPDQIAEIKIRNEEYKLSCPVLYYNTKTEVVNRVTTLTIDAFFNDDSKKNNSSKMFTLVDSEIINEQNDGQEEDYANKVFTTCVYNNTAGNKIFSMEINTDKTIGSKSLYGSFSNYQLNFLINESLIDCPTNVYILCSSIGTSSSCSIELKHSYAQQQTLTLAGKESNSEGVDVDDKNRYKYYRTAASDDVIYINIPNSTSNENKVTITRGGSELLNFNNLSSFESYFLNDNKEKMPKYIVAKESDNGSIVYSFSNEADSTAKYNYILGSYLQQMVLDGEEIEATCETIIGKNFMSFLHNNVLKIIYIGVPILLIVLTSFDFAKAVFVDDKEGIQKATKNFGKRVIVAVLIYFVPNILIFITNIIGVDEIEDCVKWAEKIAANENNS